MFYPSSGEIVIKLPDYAESDLLSAFHDDTILLDPSKGFIVYPERTDKWLSENLGIHTDSPRFNLSDKFEVHFDWNIQKWRVTA